MLQWHLQLRLGSLRSGVVLVQGSQILSSFLQTQCKSDRSQCSLSPKRSFVTTAPCYKTGPSKKVGGGTIRENLRKKYRNVMVRKEDLNKRPSDLEIAKKELPENTPTLGSVLTGMFITCSMCTMRNMVTAINENKGCFIPPTAGK